MPHKSGHRQNQRGYIGGPHAPAMGYGAEPYAQRVTPPRSRPTEEITIRIYGQNLTLTRSQWELMLEDMRPDSDNANRIFRRLADGVSRSEFGAMVGGWQERKAI